MDYNTLFEIVDPRLRRVIESHRHIRDSYDRIQSARGSAATRVGSSTSTADAQISFNAANLSSTANPKVSE